MTFTFGDNEETLRRFRESMESLLNEGDRLNEQQPFNIKPQYEDEFPIMYGWWRHVIRTASALLTLVDAGHSFEIAPLTRSLEEHVSVMNWLDKTGPNAYPVIAFENWRQVKNSLDAMMKGDDWQVPPELTAGDEPTRPTKGSPEREQFDVLLGELQKAEKRAKAFEGSEYPLYKYLSGTSHASALTANPYVTRTDNGLEYRHTAALERVRPHVIHAAACVLQAGLLISVRIEGDPLNPTFRETRTRLDLDHVKDILPGRRPPPGEAGNGSAHES